MDRMPDTYQIVAIVVLPFAAWGFNYIVRYLLARAQLRKNQVNPDEAREHLIASLRLRLPPKAELVTLAHQMYFNDERNRSAAQEVFKKNNFDSSTTESYGGRTKYWMLVKRSALVDKAPHEIQLVAGFVQSYGGKYDSFDAVI